MFKLTSLVRTGISAALIVFFSSFIFGSCVKHGSNSGNASNAGLMPVNLAPDQSAVNFSISGNNLSAFPLGFGMADIYLAIYPGQQTVSAFDFSGAPAKIASGFNNFVAGKYYSIFLTGTDSNYHVIIVNDKLDSIPGVAGKAVVRYVNSIIDTVSTPSVTVSSNGVDLLNAVSPFSTVSPFTSVPAGDITITVKNANGINVSRTVTVGEKIAYTILLIGVTNSTTTPVQIKYLANGTLGN